LKTYKTFNARRDAICTRSDRAAFRVVCGRKVGEIKHTDRGSRESYPPLETKEPTGAIATPNSSTTAPKQTGSRPQIPPVTTCPLWRASWGGGSFGCGKLHVQLPVLNAEKPGEEELQA